MVQGALLNFTHVSIDFTLKTFPACYTLLALIEIEGAKLELLNYQLMDLCSWEVEFRCAQDLSKQSKDPASRGLSSILPMAMVNHLKSLNLNFF